MYLVIFKARIKEFDQEYTETAAKLRELAMAQYGCVDFTACSEGNQEIAISTWPSLEHIAAWKNDPEHRRAQSLGRDKWYESFEVQVAELVP